MTVLIFGLPGIVIDVSVHHLVPLMLEQGVSLAIAWTVAVVGPILLNAAVIVMYYVKSERPTWTQFITQFRLQRPAPQIIWQVPLMAIAIVISNELLAGTVPYLKRLPLFAPPSYTPEIFSDVYESLDQGLANTTFMGESLASDPWWLIPFWLIVWVTLAVLGEELVWRGYLLPRQEVRYGKYAWLVNGLLWNIPFHLYTAHNFFSDMPLYFLLPFMVQRVKNTWFGIALHSLLVSLALVILIPGLVDG